MANLSKAEYSETYEYFHETLCNALMKHCDVVRRIMQHC